MVQSSHPAITLLARYRGVLSHAWAHRAELDGPARRAEEAAFLPAALSLQETPPHPAGRRLAWTLILLCLLAWAWAWLGQVDMVAVAPGRIIVEDRNKLVQPLERSLVRRVRVREGERVHAGQVLVELDPTTAQADTATLQEQLQAAQSDALRAGALLEALASHDIDSASPRLAVVPADWTAPARDAALHRLDGEWRDIVARLARARADVQRRQAEIATVRETVAKLEATLPLSRQREHDIQLLTAQGFLAAHAGQDRQRERIEMERDLATQRARQDEALAARNESDIARDALWADIRRGLSERQAQARLRQQQASQELTKARQRERQTALLAPVAGRVQQLAAHTEGGVVTDAQTLMVIVPDGLPDDPVVAEVLLDNKDIGFVYAGQKAEVKLETFPFTRHGTVSATVQQVSADAVRDERRGEVFPARLVLHAGSMRIDGKPVRLGPGMNLSAEIHTGRQRVMQYLLGPVQRTLQESLRER